MKYIFNPFSGVVEPVLDKASEIVNTPSGNLAATTVQGALNELQTEIDGIPNAVYYAGTWDASTNTPTLANSDVGLEGRLYNVSVAGSVNFGAGAISFDINDKVVNNGSIWEKWDQTDAVTSVNTLTGAVVLTTTNIAEGTNEYFTNIRAQAAVTGGASSIVTSNLTASRAVVSDGSGKIAAATTTSTEIGYVNGVTSAIQTQLNAKQATVTGAATTIVSSDLTVSRAVVSDGSGKIAAATTTAAEIGFVNGVTSAIQTQLDSKVIGPASSTDNALVKFDLTTGKLVQNSTAILTDAGALTGITQYTSTASGSADTMSLDHSGSGDTLQLDHSGSGKALRVNTGSLNLTPLTASRVLVLDASKDIAASATTSTEIGYVNGVTSAIQTQLDAKQAKLRTIVSVSSDVTLTTNAIHFVNTSSARSLTLPSPVSGTEITIKDVTGSANVNNITVVRFGSETIEGVAASYAMDQIYQSITLVADGTNWWII